MATYVEKALTKGERVVYQGKVSLWSLTPLFILGLLTIGLLGLGLLFWITAAIKYFTLNLLSQTNA